MANNIFFDTEFYENGETIELISIGMVKEDGEQLYLVNSDFDYAAMVEDATNKGSQETIEFLNNNVFNNLKATKYNSFSLKIIKELVVKYVGDKPTFWTSTGAYDWVLICQLFGRMLDLPENWPYLTMDTAQLKVLFPQVEKDMSLLPYVMPTDSNNAEHNALFDACEVHAKYLSYKRHILENNLAISI
jgi:hypothetical protein